MAALKLAEETIEPDESTWVKGLVARFKDEAIKNHPSGVMHRGAHAKPHGLVKAEFTVQAGLAPLWRVGIFKEPKTYQAWIRFSNSEGKRQPDKKRDVRGMAIKLLGVPGEKILEQEKTEQSQDFILISSNVFVTRGVRESDELAQALFGGMLAKLWYLLTHWVTLWLLVKVLRRCADPLQIRYFSCTPYLFGSHAVKYSAIPRIDTPGAIPEDAHDDYLRQALVKRLKEGEVQFDFAVQLQTDAVAMPIEDPRREWSEALSPFHKLATIRILQQDCDSAEQRSFGQNLSFSPWHSLPEHRPLGGVNRARKVVYEALSTFRHERNQAPRKEPLGWEI
ncbi:MAG: catalase family protein [Burkholderiaceae bacterium]